MAERNKLNRRNSDISVNESPSSIRYMSLETRGEEAPNQNKPRSKPKQKHRDIKRENTDTSSSASATAGAALPPSADSEVKKGVPFCRRESNISLTSVLSYMSDDTFEQTINERKMEMDMEKEKSEEWQREMQARREDCKSRVDNMVAKRSSRLTSLQDRPGSKK